MSETEARHARDRSLTGGSDRRVVLIASASEEQSLGDVATNLATVCAEVGQRVALVSTAGLASHGTEAELPEPTPLWWKQWPTPGSGAALPMKAVRPSLLSGSLDTADVEELLGETGVPGVVRLDLRYFVGHPAQVVIRVPEVLAALREIVDVVFLEVPSYLSVHHGEGLTPLADVVLIVAERETTTVDEMRRISAALRHLRAPVVGLALTDGGLEIYDWGRVDDGLQTGRTLASDERDPTEQIPISESVDPPTPSFEALPVVENAPREA